MSTMQKTYSLVRKKYRRIKKKLNSAKWLKPRELLLILFGMMMGFGIASADELLDRAFSTNTEINLKDSALVSVKPTPSGTDFASLSEDDPSEFALKLSLQNSASADELLDRAFSTNTEINPKDSALVSVKPTPSGIDFASLSEDDPSEFALKLSLQNSGSKRLLVGGLDHYQCLKQIRKHGAYKWCDTHRKKCVRRSQWCDGNRDCVNNWRDWSPDEIKCSACKKGAIRCGSVCFSQNKKCDGRSDCLNNNDEDKCETCNDQAMRCKSVRQCVRPEFWCDGKSHCKDNSDEIDCEKYICSSGYKKCADNKQCIEEAKICEGRLHCNDGSDEISCESHTCLKDYRKCFDQRQCVLKKWFCDHDHDDCRDGLDEEQRVCNPKNCSSGKLLCFDNKRCRTTHSLCIRYDDPCSGVNQYPKFCEAYNCPDGWIKCQSDNKQCIKPKWLCDDGEDCKDGWDEKNCVKCAHNTRRIANWQHCNGVNDCGDNTDEDCVECADKKQSIPVLQFCDGVSNCNDNSDEDYCVWCVDRTRRIPNWQHCNGVNDCKDRKDENNCVECADKKRSIADWQRCNGVNNCNDNSDEKDCDNHTCLTGYRKCWNQLQCVPADKFGDGHPNDCQDGLDELIPRPMTCPINQVPCPDNKRCEPYWKVCTTHSHCAHFVNNPKFCAALLTCHHDWRKCADGVECVDKMSTCYFYQCTDGSDIRNCRNYLGCYHGKGEHYMGLYRIFEEDIRQDDPRGPRCAFWKHQQPHKHTIGDSPDDFPDKRMPKNFCRNPGGVRDKPWCYTTDPDIEWGYCDIPKCDACYRGNGANYTGHVNKTADGLTCQRWDRQWPIRHNFTIGMMFADKRMPENFCRNPNGRDRPWCFTIESTTSWGYCEVTKCKESSGGQLQPSTIIAFTAIATTCLLLMA